MKTRGALFMDDLTSAARALMWCWILNEPIILQWSGEGMNTPHCTGCDGDPFELPGYHEFLGRVAKPISVQEVPAVPISVLDAVKK